MIITVWIGLIGSLLGVLIGGSITYLISKAQFKRDKEWKRKDLIRGKLEELYQKIDELDEAYSHSLMLDTAFIGIGRVPEERKRVPASHIQMLVNLYTPELKDTLQNLEQERKQYQTALLPVFEQKQRTKEEKGSLADGILITQRNISATCLQMKSRIVSMSSNLI